MGIDSSTVIESIPVFNPIAGQIIYYLTRWVLEGQITRYFGYHSSRSSGRSGAEKLLPIKYKNSIDSIETFAQNSSSVEGHIPPHKLFLGGFCFG